MMDHLHIEFQLVYFRFFVIASFHKKIIKHYLFLIFASNGIRVVFLFVCFLLNCTQKNTRNQHKTYLI